MFEDLTRYHKLALWSFILAKMCGMLGVGLGFAGGELRQLGAYLLGFAFVSIFFSVTMSIIQMGKDRDTFVPQDHIARQNMELKKERDKLLKEVTDLKKKRQSMMELKIKHHVL